MRLVLVLALIATGAWLVGNVLLGALVAPTLFAHAGHELTRSGAGAIFGDVLGRWISVVDTSLWIVVLVLLAVIVGYLLTLRRWSLLLMTLAVMGIVSGVHVWARTVAEEVAAHRPAGTTSVQLLPDDQHAAFDKLHERSEVLFVAETGVLFILSVVLAFAVVVPPTAAEPGGEAKPKAAKKK